MKALVGTFNQERALVGAFTVIVKTGCGTEGAIHSTSPGSGVREEKTIYTVSSCQLSPGDNIVNELLVTDTFPISYIYITLHKYI